jgi:hypothetical protein
MGFKSTLGEKPKPLKEKVDFLLNRLEESQHEREKERILSKFDGLYNLLITVSTFIIGIIISQHSAIGMNVFVIFPMTGVVIVMVTSFILGLKGMIIAKDSMENRILSYCLLLSLPLWYLGLSILFILATVLGTLGTQILTLAITTILFVNTLLLSKKLTNWFVKQYPSFFEGQEKIWLRIRKRITPYLMVILALTFLITIIIVWLSVQSFIATAIQHTPTPIPTP